MLSNLVKTVLIGAGAFVALVLGLVVVDSIRGKRNVQPPQVEIQVPILTTPRDVNSSNPQDSSSKVKVLKTLSINYERAVYLTVEVDENSSPSVANQITKLQSESNDPIYLFISSPGGSVFDGEKVMSAIESSRAPVTTICIDMCASMAAIIHQYGTKRYAFDRATLMFHDAFGGLRGEVKKMESMLGFVTRKLSKTDLYIAKKSGMSIDQFNKLKDHDLWVDAEDAKELGLLDDIIRMSVNEQEPRVHVETDNAKKSTR